MQHFQRVTIGLLAAALLPPALAVAQTTKPETKPETQPATTQADLPSAEEVIEQYVEAIGGEQEYRRHESLTATGTLEVPMAGLTAPFTMKAMAPDKFYMEVTMPPGFGTMRQGYNGEVGWLIQPEVGASLLEDEMLEETKRQADFYSMLHYDKLYKEMEVVEKTTFNERDAYKVRLVTSSDQVITEYFDAETHLLIGQETMLETPMGQITQTVRIGDYRDVDGIQIPHEYVIGSPQMGGEQVLQTEKIEWDTVEESAFELPEEIKTLVEGTKEKPTTQPDDADSDDDSDDEDDDDQEEEGGGGDG